ncbi:TPA: hypothetical protein SOL37_004099 [Clostridioides difficile]|uniref:hypothetical protein n=1 Tax=Clostridioides difficile TaxID=1496 RepID=UPI00038C89DF|nr:hypothetical protein [Clostridioides difficile]EKJ1276498.1 hypothetical protein [Clostridioides difficile]EQF42362.1 hypothetical protein QG1_4052 [Clostridioides difficile CD166]MDM0168385.1 hypothetical protein [Clostridioides difficile]MDM9849154.1 hypothetical protein [Clostridioides difficile]HBF0263834.1 hypothetical protein [Clostridioides difficile]
MIVTFNDVELMFKDSVRNKENNLVYEFNLYQDRVKNLITVKDIPLNIYNDISERTVFSIRCKQNVWSMNGKSGISFKFDSIVS